MFWIPRATGLRDSPYFSIGVTTFNRRDLLLETIASILGQTFADFEVIVGNDNTAEPLTLDMLGVTDRRVRILNHPVNLGEIGNMNELLAQVGGRYFTWLADDDLYTPDFLQAVRDSHERWGPLPCVFTGYSSGATPTDANVKYMDRFQRLSGRDFLRAYLDRRIQAIGCYGVFEAGFLREIGGMHRLGNGFSPYSDNLLAINAGVLEYVCYVDAPLIFFRTHEDSISFSSPDLGAYISAQEDLCERALKVFKTEGLKPDLRHNLYQLLSHWCLTFMFHVLQRSRNHRPGIFFDYMRFLRRYSGELGLYRIKLTGMVLKLLLMHWLFALRRFARQTLRCETARLHIGGG